MKFINCKKLVIFLTIGCVFITSSLSTTAVEYSAVETNGELLQAAIERDVNSMEETAHKAIMSISNNEKQALLDAKKVKKKMETNKNNGEKQYVDYYAGRYIDDNHNLVVQVTKNATKNDITEITDTLSEKVTIQTVNNSYEELLKTYKDYSEKMTELSEKVNKDKATKDENSLYSNLQGVALSPRDNANVVTLKNLTEETKREFIDYFGEKNIVFEENKESENKTEKTVIKPGSSFGVVVDTTDTTITYGIGMSLGGRVAYIKTSGETIFGFLTAGHCVSARNQITYYKHNNRYVDFGKVIRLKFSGSYDAAFIRLTNTDDFKSSRYTAYSNAQGGTNAVYKACQTCSYAYEGDIEVGETVYKCGSKTYLTKGTILSTHASVSYIEDGVTLTNLVKADYTSQRGDSGGLVFTIDDSENKLYDIAGIHSGGSTTEKFFTPLTRYDDYVKNVTGSEGYYQY